MKQFKVGDRVVCIAPDWYDGHQVSPGEQGTGVAGADGGRVMVVDIERGPARFFAYTDCFDLAADQKDKALEWLKERVAEFAGEPWIDNTRVQNFIRRMLNDVWNLEAVIESKPRVEFRSIS